VSRFDQSTISMTTEFPNGSIFYTTDGSEPSFASEPYQGPFVVTQTTTIRAIGYSLDLPSRLGMVRSRLSSCPHLRWLKL